ncbi:MAG: hypothetical protein AAGC64_12295 [Bacteroidota bacterium]
MFSEKVNNILMKSGWQRLMTPKELLNAWAQFVDECCTGYEMSIYEYDNDLSVRNAIEKILSEDNLSNYPGFQRFKESVLSIDNTFKKLLLSGFERDNQSSWWQKGVLKKAGEEYAKDIKDKYQIEIKII